MKHFFFSERGKSYLLCEYVEKERSTYDIAAENRTYANLVRRALLHHNIEPRDKSAAQKAALEAGRHTHPTEGRARSAEERKRIGEGVSRARRGNSGGTS
jgi:hypothetical protein